MVRKTWSWYAVTGTKIDFVAASWADGTLTPPTTRALPPSTGRLTGAEDCSLIDARPTRAPCAELQPLRIATLRPSSLSPQTLDGRFSFYGATFSHGPNTPVTLSWLESNQA